MTWRREAADLPAIDRDIVGQMISAQRQLPERRRHYIFHETTRDYRGSFGPGFWSRFVDLFLADAARVHVGLVSQVHQIVDHEAIVAVDVVKPAAIGPFRTFGPVQMMDLCRIGQRRVAGPDPDEAVTLRDWKSPDRRKSADALAGHRDRLSIMAHGESVIATNELAFDNFAERERSAAVGAEILDCGDLAFGATIENNALAADRAS